MKIEFSLNLEDFYEHRVEEIGKYSLKTFGNDWGGNTIAGMVGEG